MKNISRLNLDNKYKLNYIYKELEKLSKNIISEFENNFSNPKSCQDIESLIIKAYKNKKCLNLIHDERYCIEFLFEKIFNSVIKDFIIEDMNLIHISAYVNQGIKINLDGFSNIFFLMEGIILRIFEDCQINIKNETSKNLSENNKCVTALINEENIKKVREKYPEIILIEYIYGKKDGQYNMREKILKKENYQSNDINHKFNEYLLLLFIISLSSKKRNYFITKNNNISNTNNYSNIKDIEMKEFIKLKNMIEKKEIRITHAQSIEIKNYIFEKKIEDINLIKFRNQLDSCSIKINYKLFNHEIYSNIFEDQSKALYACIELFKNIPLIISNVNLIENIENIEDEKQKLFFKNLNYHVDEEIYTKYSNLFLIFKLISKSKLFDLNLDFLKPEIKEIIQKNRKFELKEGDFEKIFQPILHGFSMNFQYCLNLYSFLATKIGEYKNKNKKNKEEIVKINIEFLNIIKNKTEFFEKLRHADLIEGELEFFGFILFLITIFIIF